MRSVLSVVKARCSSYCEPHPGDLEFFSDGPLVEVHGFKLSNDVRISKVAWAVAVGRFSFAAVRYDGFLCERGGASWRRSLQ